MADSKLTDLTAETTLTGDELVYVVDDPAGTPVDRKVALSNLPVSTPTQTAIDSATSPADLLAPVTYSGTTQYSLPGWAVSGVGSHTPNLNSTFYYPLRIVETVTADRMVIEVTTAGSAGAVVRLGIYNADSTWQPGSLVVDAGDVAADSTGVKEATISQSLSPGRYLMAMNLRVASGAVVRQLSGGSPADEVGVAIGATPQISNWRASGQTISTFPSTGAAWTLATLVAASRSSIFLRLVA